VTAAVSSRLRVVVADDHPAYRAALARMLRENGIDVVGEASNGELAIRTVEETDPDVVLMDLNMPGLSGLEATRRLIDEAPSTHVLVLSVSAQDDDVSEAMQAGAHGYVLKDGPLEEVVGAIRAAAAGQAVISPRVLPALPPDPRQAG
jgi:DNA-binding NarL/FixJ family response regulator